MTPLTATATPTESLQGAALEPLRTASSSPGPRASKPGFTPQQETPSEEGSLPLSDIGSQPDSSEQSGTESRPEVQHVRVQDTPITPRNESDESGSSLNIGNISNAWQSEKMIRVRGAAPQWGPRSIVAQRVSTRGLISPMESDDKISCLAPELRDRIGRLYDNAALREWLAKRAEWDSKYRKELEHYRAIRKADREAAEKRGFLTGRLGGERVPLCALVGLSDPEMARKVGKSVDEPTHKTSVPVLLWLAAGEKADKEAVENEEDKEHQKLRQQKSQEKMRRKSMERERRKSNASRISRDGLHGREPTLENVKSALGRVASRNPA